MSVIEFPRKPAVRAEALWQHAFRETPRQRAGRKRNPLRHHADDVSYAVTIVGKLANGSDLGGLGWN